MSILTSPRWIATSRLTCVRSRVICSMVAAAVAVLLQGPTPTPMTGSAYGHFEGELDVAGQRLLPVVCQGDGEGSVILVRQAGKSEPLISEELAADLDDVARVCTVTTDPGFVLRSTGGSGWAVSEFAKAIHALGIPAPYVVVMDDSGIAAAEIDWGGRTRDILGLVLLDASGDGAAGRRFDALQTEHATLLTNREQIVAAVKLLLWQPWRPHRA